MAVRALLPPRDRRSNMKKSPAPCFCKETGDFSYLFKKIQPQKQFAAVDDQKMSCREKKDPENVIFSQLLATGKMTASYGPQAGNNENPQKKPRRIEDNRVIEKGVKNLTVKKGRYRPRAAAAWTVIACSQMEKTGWKPEHYSFLLIRQRFLKKAMP